MGKAKFINGFIRPFREILGPAAITQSILATIVYPLILDVLGETLKPFDFGSRLTLTSIFVLTRIFLFLILFEVHEAIFISKASIYWNYEYKKGWLYGFLVVFFIGIILIPLTEIFGLLDFGVYLLPTAFIFLDRID